MSPLCSTLATLSCLVGIDPMLNPPGITPFVEGRIGVVTEQGAGETQAEPFAALRLGFTWRHDFDAGARLAVIFSLEGGTHTWPPERPGVFSSARVLR